MCCVAAFCLRISAASRVFQTSARPKSWYACSTSSLPGMIPPQQCMFKVQLRAGNINRRHRNVIIVTTCADTPVCEACFGSLLSKRVVQATAHNQNHQHRVSMMAYFNDCLIFGPFMPPLSMFYTLLYDHFSLPSTRQNLIFSPLSDCLAWITCVCGTQESYS
jgi:hypothetical protein